MHPGWDVCPLGSTDNPLDAVHFQRVLRVMTEMPEWAQWVVPPYYLHPRFDPLLVHAKLQPEELGLWGLMQDQAASVFYANQNWTDVNPQAIHERLCTEDLTVVLRTPSQFCMCSGSRERGMRSPSFPSHRALLLWALYTPAHLLTIEELLRTLVEGPMGGTLTEIVWCLGGESTHRVMSSHGPSQHGFPRWLSPDHPGAGIESDLRGRGVLLNAFALIPDSRAYRVTVRVRTPTFF